ncbi:MAG: FkbM family methyltransferase [Acholeplasmataceae bacterium]|nr:FkbM family methyltransferase [Acholeplasmataceae bacterium]
MNIEKVLINRLLEIRNQIDKDESHPHKLVIWGAGNTSNLYQSCFQRNNINPECYIDKDTHKQKELFYGKNVIAPAEISKINNPFILISSQNINMTNEIKQELTEMSYPTYTVDEYIFAKNIERIENVIQLLSDEKSIFVYCSMILNRITNTRPNEEIFEGDQYYAILPFRRIASDEIFVDMGAFVGEGIEKHLFYRHATFNKIIAFEPDERNYAAMCQRVGRLNQEWGLTENKIECVFAGVGEKTMSLIFSSNLGARSRFVSSDGDEMEENKSKIYSLDDYVGELRISFLKADIEGFELKMLYGAEKVILRDQPKIAICIYHSPSDMYEIAEYLASLKIGYKFAIRQHSAELDETVLYAYIN